MRESHRWLRFSLTDTKKAIVVAFFVDYLCNYLQYPKSSRRVKASSNIASMSVTIQSLDNTAAGDQMVAASGQP